MQNWKELSCRYIFSYLKMSIFVQNKCGLFTIFCFKFVCFKFVKFAIKISLGCIRESADVGSGNPTCVGYWLHSTLLLLFSYLYCILLFFFNFGTVLSVGFFLNNLFSSEFFFLPVFIITFGHFFKIY